MIWVMLGVTTASLAISYAWWARVRVINLRQDIYDIRDELFDRVAAIDMLDDSAYRQVREHYNRLTAHVDKLSISVVVYILGSGRWESNANRFRSKDPRVHAAIDWAIEESTVRLVKYFLNETVTGGVARLVATVFRLGSTTQDQITKWARRVIVSTATDGLGGDHNNHVMQS